MAAQAMGVQIESFDVGERVNDALAAISKSRVNALMVLYTARTARQQQQIAEFAVANHLPLMSEGREFAEAGGLMTYGPNVLDLYRRAAVYADKILKGAKPSDLPIEQPTKFEFVINLKTAKALRLTIPQSLLLRADQVIE